VEPICGLRGGYEDSVAWNLKQRIVSMAMEEKIFDALVPKRFCLKNQFCPTRAKVMFDLIR
jgi:hypothetical protein